MPRTRSPNFPAIDLERAVEYVDRLYAAAQRHAMPLDSVMKDVWELTSTSSTAKQAVAALRAFGLIGVDGKGDRSKISVSENAIKILERHEARPQLLREAALLPRVNAKVWAECGGEDGLAPDQTIHNFLLFDHEPHFNKLSIPVFIRQIRATLSFAGVGSEGILSAEHEDEHAPAISHPQQSLIPPKNKEQIGMVQDNFNLPEGNMAINWPAQLSQRSCDRATAWLKLMTMKLEDAVVEDAAKGESEEA